MDPPKDTRKARDLPHDKCTCAAPLYRARNGLLMCARSKSEEQRLEDGSSMRVLTRTCRRITSLLLAGFVGAVTVHCTSSMAQTGAAGTPRTLDGRPDLQGMWTNSSITDLERPEGVAQLVLSESEAERFRRNDALYNRLVSEDRPSDPDAGPLDGSDLIGGQGYNGFWLDPGRQVGMVKGQYRSSWIVEPADGRIPYSAQGRAHAASMRKRESGYDGPEIRPLGERCLATTGRVGPPMVNGLYNNNYRIVQTRDHVVIVSEMVQHARVVRIGGKHLPAHITPHFGDSIGWWEGDTLVVETTNFNVMHSEHPHPAYLSTNAKVTERFTRYSRSQILYAYTVEDPSLYTQAWRGESSLNATPHEMYEYACHEGNYSLPGILTGARAQEQREPSAK
jgi:hypothetical protein